MNRDLETLIQSVMRYGIDLKKRLQRQETVQLDQEQTNLKRLLGTHEDARRWSEYGGDPLADEMMIPGNLVRTSSTQFLGLRYALVCWLDELLLIDSPWEADWNENKLEMSLYGTNDRAWRFWEQAKIADSRLSVDVLKTFFVCVMLGFRGDQREDPTGLASWTDFTRKKIVQAERQSFTMPPQRELKTYVPPLRGRDGFRQMILAGGVLLLVLIPVVAFFLMQFLNQADTNGAPAKSRGPLKPIFKVDERQGYGEDESD